MFRIILFRQILGVLVRNALDNVVPEVLSLQNVLSV